MKIKNRNQNNATAIEDTYPLSPLQQGMLLHTLRDPTSGVDVVQLVFELHEVLDVANFLLAWRRVAARHSTLRTSFRWEDIEQPQQEVHAEIELPWEERNW